MEKFIISDIINFSGLPGEQQTGGGIPAVGNFSVEGLCHPGVCYRPEADGKRESDFDQELKKQLKGE